MEYTRGFFQGIGMVAMLHGAVAAPLEFVESLAKGGLPIAAFDLSKGAGNLQKATKSEVACVGAYGVNDERDAAQAKEAGAAFVCGAVSTEVFGWCVRNGLPLVSGIKAVELPGKLAESGDRQGTLLAARDLVREELGFKLLHVGINCDDEGQAMEVADHYAGLLAMDTTNNAAFLFVGGALEIMKKPFLGSCGHIAFEVNNTARTVRYLECRGFPVNMETAVYNSQGEMIVVYLKEEIGRFAIHLRQK